jgi:hypothetical protein
MQKYGKLELRLHVFQTLALHRREWPLLSLGGSYPQENNLVPAGNETMYVQESMDVVAKKKTDKIKEYGRKLHNEKLQNVFFTKHY